MVAITLNEKQKENLLEMCKVLFPEYKFTFEEECLLGAYSYSFNELVYSKDIKNERDHLWKGESIHWFEFCMTHLPVALYRFAMHEKYMDPTTAYYTIIENNLKRFGDFDRYYINPIDYLYEQFKKLNL